MSIMDTLFRTAPATVPDPKANKPVEVVPPTVPPAEPKTPASPLDNFTQLWEPNATPDASAAFSAASMFTGIDPAKMLESAKKVDFAKTISPDVLTKITAGGPEAAQAFAEALNAVGQQSYAQSAFAAAKMLENTLTKFQTGMEGSLPTQIKRHSVSDAISQANPALQHPAAAPILAALQTQFAEKFPKATVGEIQKMATDYLVAFSSVANPPPPPKATPASEDWDKFVTG